MPSQPGVQFYRQPSLVLTSNLVKIKGSDGNRPIAIIIDARPLEPTIFTCTYHSAEPLVSPITNGDHWHNFRIFYFCFHHWKLMALMASLALLNLMALMAPFSGANIKTPEIRQSFATSLFYFYPVKFSDLEEIKHVRMPCFNKFEWWQASCPANTKLNINCTRLLLPRLKMFYYVRT